jgi:hypothetical protein
LIFDLSLKPSIRTKQAHINNPKSKLINRQSGQGRTAPENVILSQRVAVFKNPREGNGPRGLVLGRMPVLLLDCQYGAVCLLDARARSKAKGRAFAGAPF